MIKSNGIYTNRDLADILTNIATAYEIKNKNYFRIMSYKNAADTIAAHTGSIQELWRRDPKLIDALPGIGETILSKLSYLFTKNKLHPGIVKTFKNIHPAVFTFTKVMGIGPKNAHKLTSQLKFSKDPIKALNKLIAYAKNGKIRNLETFGEKSEKLILENTLNFLGRQDKMTYIVALAAAQAVIDYLKLTFPDVEFIPLGSLRRRSPLVGDIDIATRSGLSQEIIDIFVAYPLNIQTISQGTKKASIKIENDIRIDLMVQPSATFGTLLLHFTGSRAHNILLRKYAQTLGYSISEYGIKDLKTGRLHTFTDETQFYNFLHLNYIPPENRLGQDEIDVAKK